MLWWEQFASQNPAPEPWRSNGHRPHLHRNNCLPSAFDYNLLVSKFRHHYKSQRYSNCINYLIPAAAEQHPPGLLGGISDSHGIPLILLTCAFGSCGISKLLQNHLQVRFQRQFAVGTIWINFLLILGAIFPAGTWHPPCFAASTAGASNAQGPVPASSHPHSSPRARRCPHLPHHFQGETPLPAPSPQGSWPQGATSKGTAVDATINPTPCHPSRPVRAPARVSRR